MLQPDPYSLDRLDDIVAPDPVAWWPPTPIWQCLIALALVWCIYFCVLTMYRWHLNQYRRQALRELTAASTACGVSTLLKRVALVSFPREDVASLTGDAWLSFLDSTCDNVDFSTQPFRRIGTATYAPSAIEIDSAQMDRITDAARHWITNHRSEAR